MGFGIGLGSFVDGFDRGMRMTQDYQEREQLRADRDADREQRAKQSQWADEDRAYQQTQRARDQANRDAVDAVNQDARDTFDEGVKAGKFKDEDFDNFWTSYALPKMKHELTLQGDYEGAAALNSWGESEAAKKGGRLFAGALFKVQTGDMGGALDDAIAAGKVQGYIDHDFDIKSKEEITDASGAVVGYRLHISDSEGNQMEQDVALDDVPNMISTFANPAAAWDSQVAANAKKVARGEELADYKAKKQIDQEVEGGSKDRIKAIESLRKRDENKLDGDPTFDTMASADQEQAIEAEIALQRGSRTPAVPTPQILVDGQTGKQMPGLGGAQPQGGGGAAPGLGAVPDPRVTPGAGGDPGLPPVPTPAELAKTAGDMMVAGKDPNEIARMLKATGVDPAMWPAGLANAGNPGGTVRTSPGQ